MQCNSTTELERCAAIVVLYFAMTAKALKGNVELSERVRASLHIYELHLHDMN
jgi:hypothetical protein